MTHPLSDLRVAANQLSCNLSGETVILNLENGIYYGLNQVATRIWELLKEQRNLDEIHKTLVSEYHVEPDDCKRAIDDLVQQFLAKGLLQKAAGNSQPI